MTSDPGSSHPDPPPWGKRIEDLPIFADPDAAHLAEDPRPDGPTRPAARRPTEQNLTDPINLADYSRHPARPGRTPPASRATSWVDRGLEDLTRRGDGTDSPRSNTIDWALVTAFRAQTSDRLGEWTKANPGAPVDQRQRQGRIIITELLEAAVRTAMVGNQSTFPVDDQDRIAEAVFDAVFQLGRLQPLIDDDGIDNVEIRGSTPALVEYADGIIEYREPVADSDTELIEFLSFLGSRGTDNELGTSNERSFAPAQPWLHLQLEGRARLAASAWVTPHPIVMIRRHRLIRVTLDDLVSLGAFDTLAASFLDAAVKSRKSVVVSGNQNAGKTTLLRALAAALGLHEHIGTFETEYELYLHEMPDRHARVDPFEARPGTGELGIGGRRAGEITMEDGLINSFRFTQDRQIVGEVRGREILAMIKAMQSGTGSMSTTHAKNARAAIGKLVTCALEAGSHVGERYAERALAEGIDLLAHVDLQTVPTGDGRLQRIRRVSEIVAVEWSGDGVGFTDVFKLNAAGHLTPNVLPDEYRELERFGFDLPGYLAAGGNHSDRRPS